jgi:glyoxylase-like metal-dependent hydrolase (beta-lactamase superfamily II)
MDRSDHCGTGGMTWRAALALLLMLLTAGTAAAAPMTMRVLRINDHLLCFYDGRPAEASVPPGDNNWADFGANNVGVATYVITHGDRALVYDAYPSVRQAQWVRDYLTRMGIRHFVLVNSHWHLDHVGGNAVYADSDAIATARTRDLLIAKKAAIEAGTAWGPPAIAPLVIPDIVITADTTVYLGDIRVELRPVDIHSADGLVIHLPGDHILLAGDTLEDTLTFISEPEAIPEHYRNLAAMRQWGFDRILPNHGNPDVIAKGGYPLALIDVTRTYLRRMVEHSHDRDFLTQPIEAYLGDALRNGTVSLWWAYRDAHQTNLARVAKAWKDRALPDFADRP